MKARSLLTALTFLSALTLGSQAFCGPNDFFGSAIGGSPELTQGANGASSGSSGFSFAQGGPAGAPAAQSVQQPSGSLAAPSGSVASSGSAPSPSGPPQGDYTVDEKRVQKKYKANLKNAEKLVLRGQEMMRSQDEKVAKKGKVLKEIGEKAVADLKAANPFPEMAAKPAPTTK